MRVLLLIDIECADCEDPQLTRRRHASVATVESHVASALRRLGHEVTISYPRARLSAPGFRTLAASAQRIYRLLEMRDYGKIDIRLTPNGRMVFIEGNPNPDLSPTGFGRVASWAGYAYTDVIRAIVCRNVSA